MQNDDNIINLCNSEEMLQNSWTILRLSNKVKTYQFAIVIILFNMSKISKIRIEYCYFRPVRSTK